MKKTASVTLRGRDYTAPAVQVFSVNVEEGFFVSQNPNLQYGDEGAAGGTIEEGNTYYL